MKPSRFGLIPALVCAGIVSTIFQATASTNLALARQLNQAFVEVADKVSPSVVVITVTQNKVALPEEPEDMPEFLPREFYRYYRRQLEEENPQGQGSGVIIRKDGFILTNRHVVEDAEQVEVRLKDGRTFTATVRGVDSQSDVAVIKIDAANLPAAKFADSARTKVGEFAIAIGAPFQLEYSVTFGHVSAKGRSNIVPFYAGGNIMDQDFIQTDANINPGNSGGPLVNIDGEIIGINTLIRGMQTGIGFAIPSNLAREISEQLIASGRVTRAWLGVGIAALKGNEEYRDLAKGVAEGVVITAILPDGPAAKSDLKASDVVTAVDGRRVTTPQELRNEVRGKKIGTAMALDVYRPEDDGKFKRLTVNIEATERVEKQEVIVAKVEKNSDTNNVPASLGFTVQALTRELAEQFETKAAEGVVVTSVDNDGPAARRGIKPGDVITAINHQPVMNLRQFRHASRNVDLKKGVLLNLVSGGTARFEILKETKK